MQELRKESDSDGQFAEAIREAQNVVLGHVFFRSRREVEHMDPEQVAAYDEILAFEAYPQQLKRAAPVQYDPGLDAPNELVVEPNLRIFAEAARSYGAFNFEADSDGTYRKAPLVFHYKDITRPSVEENFYPSLDVQIARIYLEAGPDDTKLWFNQNGPELIELGPRRIVPDLSGKVLINFAGPMQTYPYVSFSDVANRETPEGMFQDKIVLVGATAVAIGDLRPTPFEKGFYPGVEIHANVLDNILHDNFLRRGFNEEMTDLLVLLFCGIVMGLLFVATRPAISAGLYAVSLAAVLGFVYHNFASEGRWLWLVLPVSTLSFNYAGIASYRVLFEEKEKRKVRGAFGQYVAPGFINQILKEPGRLQLGGEEVELTIMFSDIRSFTSISEKLTPTELTKLLNEYLTAMTEIVFQTRGTLDKYIGDAVMAFWGRPFLDLHNHAELACQAALRMSDRLKELNRGWEEQGRQPLKIGIGLNTGPVMVGNMGSARRFNYTVMGDHVNLGSRLEGLTKDYGAQIILSEFTQAHVKGKFVSRELDLIRVKGKAKPVAIYQLLGTASEQERYQDLLTDFSQALAAYKHGDWDTAHQMFEAVAERYPSDGPTKLFLSRCQRFRREAPEGVWEGVYTMTTK
jgi:adenylate cyclase